MKKRYLWGFTGLLLCGIVGLAEAHDGYRKHSPNRLLIPPQTYVDNCGSCHTAYSLAAAVRLMETAYGGSSEPF